MTTLASIEIGTNSIRMLIAEADKSGGPLMPVLRKRIITRLGEGLNRQETGTIKPGPMERSIAALGEFFGVAGEFGVSSPTILATGVVRNAENRDHFISLIAGRLGHHAKVISGEQEAQLTCKGVLSWLNRHEKPLVIFDLGGGSTEFIWTRGERKSISAGLGAVILTEDCLIADPPGDEEVRRLAHHIEDTLRIRLDPLHERGKERFLLVGTGGTIVTLARIRYCMAEDDLNEAHINGLVLRRRDIGLLFERIKGMPKGERLGIKGLEIGREDTIVAGTLVAMKIMDYFGKDEMTVSYSDLLEGSLIDQMEGGKDG